VPFFGRIDTSALRDSRMSGEVGADGTVESSEAPDRILAVLILVDEIEDDSIGNVLLGKSFAKGGRVMP
jgi:hypothetical protein